MTYDQTLLTPEELKEFLELHPGWKSESGELTRTYQFPSFREAIEYVTQLALLAEKQDHHPDIDIRYRKVILHLSTHSAGGLTFRDPLLATQADELFGSR